MKKLVALSIALTCAFPVSSYADDGKFSARLKQETARKKLEEKYHSLNAFKQASSTIVYGVMDGKSGHFKGKDYKSIRVKNHDFNFYKGDINYIPSEKITVLSGYFDHAYTAWPDDLVTYEIITDGTDVVVTDYQVTTGSHLAVKGLSSSISGGAKGVEVSLSSDSAQELVSRAFEAGSKSTGTTDWEKVSIEVLNKAVLEAHQSKFNSN